MPPTEQQEDELEQCQSPDTELSPSFGSPASDPDTAFPAQFSPVDMATVSANSMGSSDSGVYSYATVTPLSQPAATPAARSPKSPRIAASRSHVYEEIGKTGGGQFCVVGDHSNQMEETVTHVHQNILYESTGPFGDGGVEESAVGATSSVTEEQYEVQGNPLYNTIELTENNHNSVQSVLSSQASVGAEEYEIQENPLYQSQSDGFQHLGHEED